MAKKSNRSVTLLSGGNPQIAKADGDAPVQAYIAAMPGWKRDAGRRLDALITRAVPKVTKAVKWNSPLYGVEGRGWFVGACLPGQIGFAAWGHRFNLGLAWWDKSDAVLSPRGHLLIALPAFPLAVAVSPSAPAAPGHCAPG